MFETYGLWVHADQPIEGVESSRSAPRIDVELFVRAASPVRPNRAAGDFILSTSPHVVDGRPAVVISSLAHGGFISIVYCDGTEFVIDRDGRRIWANHPDAVTGADIASYLLGPVLGVVLRLRTVPCLHASAVTIGGGIVAFTGPSEAGKTTLAAAFARMGFPVVTDDILPLETRETAVWGAPAYPRLRLWAPSIHVLSTVPSCLPPIPLPPPNVRHHLDLRRDGYRFESAARQLRAVYCLQPRDEWRSPRIDACVGAQAVIGLLANGYASALLGGATRQREFAVAGQLAATIGLRRLYPHPDPRRITQLCETILDDLEALDVNAAGQESAALA